MFGHLTSRATKVVAVAALAGAGALAVGASTAQADTNTHLTTVNMGNIAAVCRAHSGTLIVGSAGTNCILPGNLGTIECWRGLGCDLVTFRVITGVSTFKAPAPIGARVSIATK